MAISIRITHRAYDDIDGIVGYIARDAPEAAKRWRKSILHRIGMLNVFPLKHGLAPEAYALGVSIRQTIHGDYRILYTVEEDALVVHGVRHSARQPLGPGDLPTLP
jgi:plasmid stabilization system protein ParE